MKQQPTQVAQSNIDFTELVNEIKKLRETFEVALLSQKVLSLHLALLPLHCQLLVILKVWKHLQMP